MRLIRKGEILPQIMDYCEFREVTEEQIQKLIAKKLIYHCPSCRAYHIELEKTWKTIEAALAKP
jgi:ssDNA-binding Zn-finger/Zn-ribbon topoisomerase 1